MQTDLNGICVGAIDDSEAPRRNRELMVQHHNLGHLPKIGYAVWHVATYVLQPVAFRGTVCRVENWTCVSLTQGVRRVGEGYGAREGSSKLGIVGALRNYAQAQLRCPVMQEN